MIALTLPAPELPPGAPQIEQPLELKLPAIVFDDGIEATDAEAQNVGTHVYRIGPGGEELWNETERRWAEVPDDLDGLPPLPLTYKAGDPFPWQGMLVAIGQKDKDGNPRFEVAAGGEPRYRLRTYARFQRDGGDYAGLSIPSADIEFVRGAEKQRFGVQMTPGDPQLAETVRIQLKSASLAPAGYVEIRAAGGAAVEIGNFDPAGAPLAVVQLAPDGSIRLQPAAGMKVVLAGDLEARRIRYLSSDGTTTKDLA